MRKNVGLFDAFLRTMIGFSMFGKGINWKSSIMVCLASMLIATGLTRYCPCYQMLNRSSLDTPWKYAKAKAGKIMH